MVACSLSKYYLIRAFYGIASEGGTLNEPCGVWVSVFRAFKGMDQYIMPEKLPPPGALRKMVNFLCLVPGLFWPHPKKGRTHSVGRFCLLAVLLVPPRHLFFKLRRWKTGIEVAGTLTYTFLLYVSNCK